MSLDRRLCGRHRPALLNGSRDPGAFFVKTLKTSSRDAAYNQHTFYSAWRQVIQRYGIHNPYTGRGRSRACFLTGRTM